MTDGLVSWSIARRAAREAADSLPVVSVPLAAAVGAVLAEPLVAETALPPADAARVDGWAVSGPGPWTVVPGPVDHLADGCAVEVGAGGVLPFGADSVLRADHAVLEDRLLHVGDPASGWLAPHSGYVEPGSDVRPRGEEAAAGETLLQAGGIVTPAVAALAASAGLDQLPVVRPPDVAIVVPERGRDVLGPMLPGWVAWAGGRAFPPVRVLGGLPELVDVIDDANSDVIVVTGATSTSDDVHRAVAQLSGRWVVDGVAVRPGTASSLAVLPDGRRVVSLPEAPLGAVAGVLTLLVPLLAVLRGELGADESRTEEAVLADDVPPGLPDTEGFVRLVPVIRRRTSLVPSATPLPHDGPAALRGIALADGLAVVAHGAGARGTGVLVLPLP
jgi:molybdopterin molybdotransferase